MLAIQTLKKNIWYGSSLGGPAKYIWRSDVLGGPPVFNFGDKVRVECRCLYMWEFGQFCVRIRCVGIRWGMWPPPWRQAQLLGCTWITCAVSLCLKASKQCALKFGRKCKAPFRIGRGLFLYPNPFQRGSLTSWYPGTVSFKCYPLHTHQQ